MTTELEHGHGCRERFENVRRICEEIGRDPATLRMSATTQVICGATREEAQQRLQRLGPPGERMLATVWSGRRPT